MGFFNLSNRLCHSYVTDSYATHGYYITNSRAHTNLRAHSSLSDRLCYTVMSQTAMPHIVMSHKRFLCLVAHIQIYIVTLHTGTGLTLNIVQWLGAFGVIVFRVFVLGVFVFT